MKKKKKFKNQKKKNGKINNFHALEKKTSKKNP